MEARLAGEDALAVDDRAFALVPQEEVVRALLVSDGNTYLESALALLPRLELYAVAPDDYEDALAEADEAEHALRPVHLRRLRSGRGARRARPVHRARGGWTVRDGGRP